MLHVACFMLHAARCILAAGDFGCPIPSIVRRRNYAHTGAGESAGAFAARRSAASTAFYTNTSAFPNIQGRVNSRHGSAVHFRVCQLLLLRPMPARAVRLQHSPAWIGEPKDPL
jgi:hypothetical protein